VLLICPHPTTSCSLCGSNLQVSKSSAASHHSRPPSVASVAPNPKPNAKATANRRARRGLGGQRLHSKNRWIDAQLGDEDGRDSYMDLADWIVPDEDEDEDEDDA
jgi:hypothetical protein